jgi:hypothetical protein
MPTSKTRIVPDIELARDGRQHGFLRLFHSVHSSAYGFIPIPIVVLKNGDGPTALFLSGNHGDEYEGQVALCNLPRDHPARCQFPRRDGWAAHLADRRGQPEPQFPRRSGRHGDAADRLLHRA